MIVELTKHQCRILSDYIEMTLLDVIRNDLEIENLGWVESLILAKNELEKAVKYDDT